MKTINSKRKFRISGFESGNNFSREYYLADFFIEDDDTEFCYSMQDNIDAILDLEIDDSLVMFCNRDSKISANTIIVWRIQ